MASDDLKNKLIGLLPQEESSSDQHAGNTNYQHSYDTSTVTPQELTSASEVLSSSPIPTPDPQHALHIPCVTMKNEDKPHTDKTFKEIISNIINKRIRESSSPEIFAEGNLQEHKRLASKPPTYPPQTRKRKRSPSVEICDDTPVTKQPKTPPSVICHTSQPQPLNPQSL